ncbi:hypothetical protein GCM10023317_94220 [Actinopolymorpha pittospori]
MTAHLSVPAGQPSPASRVLKVGGVWLRSSPRARQAAQSISRESTAVRGLAASEGAEGLVEQSSHAGADSGAFALDLQRTLVDRARGLLDRVDLVELRDRLRDLLLGRVDLSLAADGSGNRDGPQRDGNDAQDLSIVLVGVEGDCHAPLSASARFRSINARGSTDSAVFGGVHFSRAIGWKAVGLSSTAYSRAPDGAVPGRDCDCDWEPCSCAVAGRMVVTLSPR